MPVAVPFATVLMAFHDRFLCLGFGTDLAIRVLREQKLENKFEVILSVEGLLDIVSFVPTLIEVADEFIGDENFHVLPSLNLLRVFR